MALPDPILIVLLLPQRASNPICDIKFHPFVMLQRDGRVRVVTRRKGGIPDVVSQQGNAEGRASLAFAKAQPD
ncbi:MAG: hypothetical protein HXX15_21100 [Rhodopseudomonas sp.]|uniref:hypothetical protein n=1 Tax=Rhodopseudomonas sp. TaxID=1078 RepID=UPI0017934DB1|nr:hypothetical protein [Rhodopseudomonas sp.]NVN88586.1 hypothetical protein [Rhodopseudomonas sp.]